ncbi:hypothetical protein DXG03_001724 [Asterophora parasitica]|uniref:Complex 1 LYR protein domain-containing protein n=1 Tax=Asterophora parasitica TaxID=117018 RepID=A0A9P7GCU4_9AGAR|nr:hypothetical protein DXG03_001724 [Asterophora parasitica]
MQKVAAHLPSQSSLAFRTNLANLISPLRRVRPRVPFFKLAAHRIPTLSLYRGLLREASSEEIKHRVRMVFRETRPLTGTDATKRNLEQGYKFLDAFKRANGGDLKQRAILERYTRALGIKADKAYWRHLMHNEIAWRRKLARRPIMTGGYLRPTYANGPLPRLRPQPAHISMMIFKRRRARQRRHDTLQGLQGMMQDLRLEAEFESGLGKAVKGKGQAFEPAFAGHMEEWLAPLKQFKENIHQTYVAARERAIQPYSAEMLDAIKTARREKIVNKTRERARERGGEILRCTIRRLRKAPPPHVLSRMTPEQRRMDKIARNVSEVGYVAQVKRRLGHKLREPEKWKLERGRPENKEGLDRASREIREESNRRMREEVKRMREIVEMDFPVQTSRTTAKAAG